MAEEDVFKHMQKVKKNMDSAFENFFTKPKMLVLPTMGKQLMGFKEPLGEIFVKGDKVLARLEMPGVDKKDVLLNVTPSYLEVKAEKKQKNSFVSFYRKLPLPLKVNPQMAEYHFREGVLEISMPKLDEKKRLVKK
ncbi:MAG: Hsp20/alpha crystallin family protein [Candidatus Nanoarchaeia archaeon]|jgi:HSP20 family protein